MTSSAHASTWLRTLVSLGVLCGARLVAANGNAAPNTASGSQPNARFVRDVNAYMAPFVAMRDFSGTILVARGGKVLARRAYGLADQELAVPATPETAYGIGSVTKTFTAAAIERLAERGRLALADPLSKFFPAFPRGENITLAHVLAHGSGIPDYYQLPEYAARRFEEISPADFVSLVAGKPLDFEPGSSSRYSNSGYHLLASVIERVSGMPYAEFLRTEFFVPLGMRHTGNLADRQLVPGLASGYDAGFPPEGLQHAAPVSPSWLEGNGSLYSTVDDLLRWADAVRTDRFVKATRLPYPYGWGVRKRFDRDLIEQSGRVPIGYVSYLAIYPKDELVIVVLGNIQVSAAERVGIDLAAIAFGAHYELPSQRPVPASPPDSAVLAPFAGRYEIAPGFVLTVIADRRGLSLAGTDGAFLPVDTTAPPRFFFRPLYVDITFERNSTGQVVSLDWGGQVKAKRVP